ncbi:MAG TPA: signal peptidase I [Solirubrobacteraceae bacterium]|nr:signal peptidase I [Solirubrobacteraceae bacterium]
MPRRLAALLEVLLIVGLAIGIAEGVQAEVIKPFKIPSGSMEPTLIPGQRVLVNRFIYDLRSPERGDIVVLHPPSELICAVAVPGDEPCPRSIHHEASDYFIKRIEGLPGQTLSVRDGHPVINGKEITHEPYITPCGQGDGCNLPVTIRIPKGEYFVMGDNRGDSDDSRFWGPVPRSWIVGEAFLTYWPPDRIGFP